MAKFSLLLLVLTTLACDNILYSISKIVYVNLSAASTGSGTECSPYLSLVEGLNIVISGGGVLNLSGAVSIPSVTTQTISTEVTITGSGQTLSLSGTWLVDIVGKLSLESLALTQGAGLTGSGFEVKGVLVLKQCTVSQFSLPAILVSNGDLEVRGGTLSGNSQTVVQATGVEMTVLLKDSTFAGNSGPVAGVLNYDISTLKMGSSFPAITLEGITVTQTATVPVVNVKFTLTELPVGTGLIKVSQGTYTTVSSVFTTSVTNLEIQITGTAFVNSSIGLKVSSTNAPVTVSNSIFSRITGTAIYIENSSSTVTISGVTCTVCTQAISLVSPTSTCNFSQVTVQNSAGANAMMLASCSKMTTSQLTVDHNTGPVIDFKVISLGEHTDMSVSNSTCVGGTLVALTDSTKNTRTKMINNFATVTIFSIKGSLTSALNDFLMENCTSAQSLVGLSDNAMYQVNKGRIANSYSELSTFLFGTVSTIYIAYYDLELDGVSSGQSVWRAIGSARSVLYNSRFKFSNSSLMVVTTSAFHFNFTNIDLTGSFKNFIDGSPTLPTIMNNLNFHDIRCQGLFKGNTFTLTVYDSDFRNITVVDALLTIQSSMTMSFTNVTFNSFQGRLFIMSQTTLVMSNATFYNCSTMLGDPLMTTTQTVVDIQDVKFINFTGTSSGALFKLQKSSVVTLTNVILKNFTMRSDKGFIYVSQSNFTLRDSIVRDYNSSMIEATLGVIVTNNCNVTDGGARNASVPATFDGGYIRSENCPSIVVLNSNFSRIAASSGGVISAVYSNPAFFIPYNEFRRYLVSINATYEDCTAGLNGGVFYLSDASSWIVNNAFLRNHATNGGAMQMLCAYFDTSYYCNYTLVDVFFRNNSAKLGAGGGYSYSIIQPWITNIDAINNTAKYGDLRAGYPVTLRRVGTDGRSIDAESGVTLHSNLTFGLFDLHNQLVTTENSSPAVAASNTSSATLVGVTKQFPKNGIYYFDSFSVLDQPGATVELFFQSEALDYVHPDPNSNLTPSAVPLTSYLRLCLVGEIQVASQCVLCTSGSYSFHTTDVSCTNCIIGMQCLGGASVLINPGYWRPNNLSDSIFKCPYETTCLGKADSECDQGYEGRLCTVCSNSYLRLGKFQCAPCGSEAGTIARGVGVAFAFVALLAYITYGALSSAEKVKSPTGPLTRILLNYIQTFSLVVNFNLDWPYQILSFTGGVSLIGSGASSAFSTTCISFEFGTKEVYLKLLMMAVLPIILSLLSFVVWGIVAIRKRSIRFIRDHFLCTVIVIILAMHPNVLSSALSMIACQSMEEGSSWLIADFREECWKGDHAFYTLSTALPAFLIWVVAAPLIMLVGFVKSRKFKDQKSVKVRYSFLSTGYRSDHFYWEFVILARKTSMLALQSTLASSTILVQVFSTLMLLWVFYKIHIKMLPFNLKKLNAAEAIAILSVIVNTITGLLLTYDKSKSVAWEVFVVFLYMLSTAVFFTFWLVSIVLTWKEKLFAKFPMLARFFSKFSTAMVASSVYTRASGANDLQSREPRRLPITH